MEWRLTQPSTKLEARMHVRIYKLKMKHLQKKRKNGCAGFSTSQLQASKDSKPNTTADAVPTYKDRTHIANDLPDPQSRAWIRLCVQELINPATLLHGFQDPSQQAVPPVSSKVDSRPPCKDWQKGILLLPLFLLASASLQRHGGFDVLSTCLFNDGCKDF